MTPHLFPVNHKFIRCWDIDPFWEFGALRLLWGLWAIGSLYRSSQWIFWWLYLSVPLGCWVGKLLGVPLGFKLFNIVGILLWICDVFLLGFSLNKKLENQEGLLDGDCVGSLLGFVMVVIIGISVGKPYGDKVGCWLGKILGIVLNTEVGNFESF